MPLWTLVAVGLGFLVTRLSGTPERPLDVTPPPEAQLTGIVLPPRTRVLAGSVVGPGGGPIAGALVSTIASDEPHWTYADESGAFVLEGLGRGPWTVTVAATAHLPFTTTIAEDAQEIVLRLPDAPRAYPRLAPCVRSPLEGTVSAPPGAILAGVEVSFVPVLPLEEIDAPFPRRTQCDSGGRFTIPDLQVGEYTVIVLPEWAQNGSWPDLSRALGEPPHRYAHAADGPRALALGIAAGAVRGVVMDGEQNPLAGALVLVCEEPNAQNVWPPATTDAEGAFTVPDLPPGRYVVSVRAGSGAHQATVVVREREVTELALPPLSVERPR